MYVCVCVHLFLKSTKCRGLGLFKPSEFAIETQKPIGLCARFDGGRVGGDLHKVDPTVRKKFKKYISELCWRTIASPRML